MQCRIELAALPQRFFAVLKDTRARYHVKLRGLPANKIKTSRKLHQNNRQCEEHDSPQINKRLTITVLSIAVYRFETRNQGAGKLSLFGRHAIFSRTSMIISVHIPDANHKHYDPEQKHPQKHRYASGNDKSRI